MVTTSLEFDVAEWLLNNKDDIKATIQLPDHYDLFPDKFKDVFLHQYKDHLKNKLITEIMKAFNLSFEESSLLFSNKQYKILLGRNYFII